MYPSDVTLASSDSFDEEQNQYSGQSHVNRTGIHAHRIAGAEDEEENDGGAGATSPSHRLHPQPHSHSHAHPHHFSPSPSSPPTLSTSFSNPVSVSSTIRANGHQKETGNTLPDSVGGSSLFASGGFTTETPMTTLPKPPTLSSTDQFTSSPPPSQHLSSPSPTSASVSPFHPASSLYPNSDSFIPMAYHRPSGDASYQFNHKGQFISSSSSSSSPSSSSSSPPPPSSSSSSSRVKNRNASAIPVTSVVNEKRGLEKGSASDQSGQSLGSNSQHFIPLSFSPTSLTFSQPMPTTQFTDHNSTLEPIDWSALLLNYTKVVAANENFNNTIGFADVANSIRNSYKNTPNAAPTSPSASSKRKRTRPKGTLPNSSSQTKFSPFPLNPNRGTATVLAGSTSSSTTTSTSTSTTSSTTTPRPAKGPYFEPNVGLESGEDELSDQSNRNNDALYSSADGEEDSERTVTSSGLPTLLVEDSTISISDQATDEDLGDGGKAQPDRPFAPSDDTSDQDEVTTSHPRTLGTKSRTKGAGNYIRRPYTDPGSGSSVDYYPHQPNSHSTHQNVEDEGEDSAGSQLVSSSSSSPSPSSPSPSSSQGPSSHYGHLFDPRYIPRFGPHRYFLPSSHSLSSSASSTRPYYAASLGYPYSSYSPSGYSNGYYSNRHYYDSSDSGSSSSGYGSIHRQGGSSTSSSSSPGSSSSASSSAWASGLTGFLLGIIPLSLIVASMVPAFVSVPVAAAAGTAVAGRRRRRRRSESTTMNNTNATIHFNRANGPIDAGERSTLNDTMAGGTTNSWSSSSSPSPPSSSSPPSSPSEASFAAATVRSDLYTYKTVHPVIELLVEYGMNSLDDPKCLQELFCQVVAGGKKSRSNVVQKMFYSIASL